MKEILEKRFNEEIKRVGESKITDSIKKEYEVMKSYLCQMEFIDSAIDILPDGLKFTLLFDEDRLLMITKSKESLTITYFFQRKLIYADSITDLSEFITKFNQYLKNKN
jgi:hypothetical protein